MKRPYPFYRGQTTLDYILVLAVVLLIGLIALGLSGTWPDLALNTRNQQSVTFWRDQVRPITIPEAYYNYSLTFGSGQTYAMLIQTQIDEPLVLTGIFIDGVQIAIRNSGGTYQCNPQTCRVSQNPVPCSCTLALGPRQKTRIKVGIGSGTDNLGTLGCTFNGQIIRVPVNLVYYRPSEPNRNLSENTTVDMPVTCMR